MGLNPGKEIEVISKAPGGSVIVAIQNNRIGVDGGMANKIMASSDRSLAQNRQQANSHKTLKDLKVGTKGIVTQYQKSCNKHQKGYRRKLLAMGLTPGTEFTVTRVAPLGDPVEIMVRGFKLSLRKEEADSLGVQSL
jgi:ferrous iron transport protein A